MTNNWWLKTLRYAYFNRDVPGLDWSLEAAEAAYNHETFGTILKEKNNGYQYAKKSFDITLEIWRKGLFDGLFVKFGLI